MLRIEVISIKEKFTNLIKTSLNNKEINKKVTSYYVLEYIMLKYRKIFISIKKNLFKYI